MNEDTLLEALSGSMDDVAIGRIIVSVLASVVLGWLLQQAYHLYYRGTEPLDYSMARSFPLMMPAVTLIFILVQYSLPLSLGLLGAMSFVRFRSPVKRAEDIAFILVLIACALSCGVQYYHAAVILLAVVAAIGLARRLLPGASIFSTGGAVVTIRTSARVKPASLDAALGAQFGKPAMLSSRTADGANCVVFTLKGHRESRDDELQETLAQLFGPDASVEVFYPENQTID